MIATIHIKNLRVRTIIGVYDWEQAHPQDIVLNVRMDFDATAAAASDDVADAVDYKAIKQRIVELAESSHFKLLEKLAAAMLEIIMSDEKVLSATVEIDKPHALQFTDSVSVTCSASRN